MFGFVGVLMGNQGETSKTRWKEKNRRGDSGVPVIDGVLRQQSVSALRTSHRAESLVLEHHSWKLY